jgi:PD-(D/E)XK nuclease superfamily
VIGQEYIFSASQITTFNECKRKWAWDRIAKIPRATHPSAAKGTRCHSQWERYLTTGETPRHALDDGSLDETGAIAEVSLDDLPQPFRTPGLEVEQKFAFSSPRTGYIYRGFIDFRYPLRDGWALVGDHKTTSNLAYAKTPEDLLTDPQAIIYAVETMAYYKVPNVRLHWNYVSTKRPYRSLPVYQEMSSPHAVAAFLGIEETAGIMAGILDTVGADDILSLEPNLSACNSYGGCPYRFKCNLSPMDTARASFAMLRTDPTLEGTAMSTTPTAMSRLELMRARMAGLVPSSTPAPAIVGTKFGPAVQEDLPATAVADPPSAPVVAPLVKAGQINPPEQSPVQTAEQLHDNEQKAKRTRRTKVEMEAARAAEAKVINQDFKEAVAEVQASPPTPAVPVLPILFVDCLPTKGVPYVDVSGLTAEANKAVCAKMEVGDYRYVDYKGSAMMVEAALALVQGTPGNCIRMDSDTPEGKALLNPLSALATVVVRGSR